MLQFIPSILVGWGFCEALVIIRSLPDPPPPLMRGFITRGIAAIIGAAMGGLIFAGSNPMPAHQFIGAAAGAAVVVGLAQALLSGRAR